MRNQDWGWIDLQEEHLRKTLQEEDPSFNSMATSAPLGDIEDGQIRSWDLNFGWNWRADSLVEFRSRLEFVRHRLTELLEAVDPVLGTTATSTRGTPDVLTALRATYDNFCALHDSPLAWQSIHAGDAKLMSRAANALRELGM